MLIPKIRLSTAILLSTVFMLAAAGGVFAHPPSGIVLSFDPETSQLTVAVQHGIGDPMPEGHYVKSVTVFLNDEEIIHQIMFSQSSSSEQEVWYYIIDAGPGDTLEVLAECSIFGTVREHLNIE